ncbi:hypothetical protein MJM83_34410, partial [Salmonella enterica subsp. enterica serovar Montevideo]|nr:hypothetical protein [Salmonella enterica subsp. enterica serovar Montevideo]
MTVSLATLVAAGAFPAHAGPQAHVVCGYHHTLGDDAIMMFGKEVMTRRREIFTGMGIEFKLNTEVGRDVQLEDLLKDYDAVFL